jgi:hypothetical protein
MVTLRQAKFPSMSLIRRVFLKATLCKLPNR